MRCIIHKPWRKIPLSRQNCLLPPAFYIEELELKNHIPLKRVCDMASSSKNRLAFDNPCFKMEPVESRNIPQSQENDYSPIWLKTSGTVYQYEAEAATEVVPPLPPRPVKANHKPLERVNASSPSQDQLERTVTPSEEMPGSTSGSLNSLLAPAYTDRLTTSSPSSLSGMSNLSVESTNVEHDSVNLEQTNNSPAPTPPPKGLKPEFFPHNIPLKPKPKPPNIHVLEPLKTFVTKVYPITPNSPTPFQVATHVFIHPPECESENVEELKNSETVSRVPSLPGNYLRIELPPDQDPLPPNWEARMDSHGRTFYIDHKHKTTSWNRPCPSTSTSEPTSSVSPRSDAMRKQLDRRYQSIRRTIGSRSDRVTPCGKDPSPSSSPVPPPLKQESPVPVQGDSENWQASPALRFLTRPDFFSLLHTKEEALKLFHSSSAVRHMLTKIWREPSSFPKYQHSRELVQLVNLFADENEPLPSGWEGKKDKNGRAFFVDHNRRITTFLDPRLPISLETTYGRGGTLDMRHSSRRNRASQPRCSSQTRSSTPSSQHELDLAPPPLPPRPASNPSASCPAESQPQIPSAYNEKVIAFLRQPNILDILKARYPDISGDSVLKDKVNVIRVEGSSALERMANELDVNILLSLFEDDVMSYIPAAASSSGSSSNQQVHTTRHNRSSHRHFDAKLRHFYQKLESKGYAQGPSKLKINIRRDYILEDGFSKIMSASKKELQRSKLHISFIGEDALDYGGPGREFFFLISRQLFNPYYGLFEYSAQDTYTVQISPLSSCIEHYKEWFRFCGRVLGLALVHQYLLDVFFTRPFYKELLCLSLCLSDLESVDPEFYQSVTWLKENIITNLDLTFCVTEEIGGKHFERELKANGKNISVTEKNKKDYIQRLVKWRLERGVSDQMNCLLRGFTEVVDSRLASIFDARELELVLAGTVEIDVADWRRNTEYRSGYFDGHQVIQWFWQVIDKMDDSQRLKLLQFVTGTSSVPYEGFSALRGSNGPKKFCIEKWGNPDSLPRAHTCFNRLDLPSYPSFTVLYEKLMMAIQETSSFGIE
ncbi:hypothetical protein QYM36_013786 [Artemia franciscana]|uniref:HECT-type E3 ubiquitin transferase n=1 Tax=Artemia franciscana TaxID=6661 RepID=A0AA88HR10_ARTSF|nr:hypothetical protein QYM36_013786 [Artemia franciscana]